LVANKLLGMKKDKKERKRKGGQDKAGKSKGGKNKGSDQEPSQPDGKKRGPANYADIGRIADQCWNFKYPQQAERASIQGKEAFHHQKQARASGIASEYSGGKSYRDTRHADPGNEANGSRNQQFKQKQFGESGTATDVTGRQVNTTDTAPKGADGKPDRGKVGEADHVIPLKRIDGQYGSYSRRYTDEEDIKRIVNSDSNFQLLAGDTNAAKGGARDNLEFIAYTETIDEASKIYAKPENERTDAEKQALKDMDLSDAQKRAARKKAKGKELTPEEQEALKKYELSPEAKKEMEKKQKEAEAELKKELLKSGLRTVGWEWVGNVVETIVGPIAFEIRDSFKNGITHGFDDANVLEALGKRLWRILCYMGRELPRLLGDLLGDLAQMLAMFFAGCWKALKNFFGKVYDLVINGISVIVGSIKILLTPKMSGAEKGNAIVKLAMGFLSGTLVAVLIDKALNGLGIPDPFSEIAAVLVSGVLSTVFMHYFDKIDLFNTKGEVRLQRIKEIFGERTRQLREDTSKFDLAVSERLKANRQKFEKLRHGIDQAIESGDVESLNEELDDCAAFLKVDLPYSSPEEFVAFVRTNSEIRIA
jgi:hypothetical protein